MPIPFPVLAVVLVAIFFFGIVLSAVVRALCLATAIVEILTTGVRVRLTNAAIALVSWDIRECFCSARGIAATVLREISTSRHRSLSTKRFTRQRSKILLAQTLSLYTPTAIVLVHRWIHIRSLMYRPHTYYNTGSPWEIERTQSRGLH